ncbi:protein asteroid-like [Diabrotica undecimpunctata]|uniref:protein asteroid-like n=1 Tax=Diabrotica undecimpunctata TaxID=50387 RepID=UPI003B641CAF
MGIRGLTTFIQNRAHLYLENYELHDSNIVIDGNSIACQLYKWHTSSHDCFGGDYDKFRRAIHDFFDLLNQCNITPYVVLDGGYEHRKVNTVISRMKKKIKSANQLNCVTETSISVFPLLIKQTFRDVLAELKMKHVGCDFEGDTETSNIARTLNCPVLSFDSDYFIFDVLYVPFSTFEMAVKRSKTRNTKTSYKYIACKVYRVEKFLKSFEGLQKTSLPVLAVLLGNDYVKRGVFTMFYQNLKIQKCHGTQSDQQKRIKSLLVWLQNETVESALKKVLSRYKKGRRNIIMYKIKQAIKGYNCFDSKYLKYLGIEPNLADKTNVDIDLETINNSVEEPDESESHSEVEDTEGESSSPEEDVLFVEESPEMDVPSRFLEKFRLCIYPPCFMDILIQNKYYCIPQVENNALEHSHKICFDILSAIHSILTSNNENLLCIGRKGAEGVAKEKVPICNISLPSYNEIEALSKSESRKYIFNILSIDNSYEDCLKIFPDSWHILLLSLYYYLKKSTTSFGWPMVYGIILSKLILTCVDIKLETFCRSSKAFFKKFGNFVSNNKPNETVVQGVNGALDTISQPDSILCLKALISYFEMDYKMTTNYKSFDRSLVHSISEFQSCAMHVEYLNVLFDCPFSNFCISKTLNCTFVYNITKNLNKRTNLDEYMKLLLKDSPSVLYSLNFIVTAIKNYIQIEAPQQVIKKRRKKKTAKEVYEETEKVEFDSDGEVEFDPNNKFALLRIC